MSQYNDKYGDFFESYSPNRPPSDEPPQKKRKKKRPFKFLVSLLALILVGVIAFLCLSKCNGDSSLVMGTGSGYNTLSSATESTVSEPLKPKGLSFKSVDTTKLIEGIDSTYAVLADCSDSTILASRLGNERMYPASMTKIMTLLVAAENVTDIGAKFLMTSKIIDPLYKEEATMAGFCPGEEVEAIDLFYGTVLVSGAEAAAGLAVLVAGSEERFIEMMNEKVQELGLKNTHFTNMTGLHDKDHYSTCIDMAVIMRACIENDFCKTILSTEYYTVKKNSFHEEIKFHSTMFSRMYGTEPEVVTILGGKTGYTSNSGHCLVTYGESNDGRTLISVTAAGEGRYKPIYDTINIYKNYSAK